MRTAARAAADAAVRSFAGRLFHRVVDRRLAADQLADRRLGQSCVTSSTPVCSITLSSSRPSASLISSTTWWTLNFWPTVTPAFCAAVDVEEAGAGADDLPLGRRRGQRLQAARLCAEPHHHLLNGRPQRFLGRALVEGPFGADAVKVAAAHPLVALPDRHDHHFAGLGVDQARIDLALGVE